MSDEKNYLLRNIPEDLWIEAKIAAAQRGMSLRDLLLEALRKAVSK